MTLMQFFNVLAAEAVIHVGTEHGQGWLFTGTPRAAASLIPDMLDREIVHIFPHEGREANEYCRELLPGLAIEVEGSENGQI